MGVVFDRKFLLSSKKLFLLASILHTAGGAASCGTAAAGGGCLQMRRKLNKERNQSTESLVTGQIDISHAADVCRSDRGFRQRTERVGGGIGQVLEHVLGMWQVYK